MEGEKITVTKIQQMKRSGKKITMLTAYDYPTAKIVDQAGIDMILVGDSLANVVLGYPNTIPVTIEEMLHHCRAVCRACKQTLVIGDMPFMSYQVSIEEALRNAGRFLKEGGVEAVKLEGGVAVREKIRAMVDIGIPVMGHVGLTPQSVHKFGGHKIQGRKESEAERIIADAKAVEEAGAFSLVLEGIPRKLSRLITEELTIPTIGIGAGPDCDGQVLVIHDMLGLYDDFKPKFVKRYANLKEVMLSAIVQYKNEVEQSDFPTDEYSFH